MLAESTVSIPVSLLVTLTAITVPLVVSLMAYIVSRLIQVTQMLAVLQTEARITKEALQKLEEEHDKHVTDHYLHAIKAY